MSHPSNKLFGLDLVPCNEIAFYGNGSTTERAFDRDGKAILWWIDGQEVSEREYVAKMLLNEPCKGLRNQFVCKWEEQPQFGLAPPRKAR